MFATVVFVSDGETEESTPGYDDYGGSGRGIVVCDDDGATETIGEPDEMLSLVNRG
jgi:RecJ-like exonuclease